LRKLQDETQSLYGKWEDYSQSLLPELDACNGHWGFIPESPTVEVYHYHLSEHAPFTIGCVGPNDDGSLVTIAQCRSLYDDCSDTAEIEIFTVLEDGVMKTIPYIPWCPCYDTSGLGVLGAGLNVGNVDPTRAWYVRSVDSAGTWSTTSTGVFSDLAGFESGITVVDKATSAPVATPSATTAPTSATTYRGLRLVSVMFSVVMCLFLF
jgi:hypothetical protein